MQPIRLDLENLTVDSFQTTPADQDPSFLIQAQDPAIAIGGGGFCCTGCVSGCGINPTASGCASGGGDRTILLAY
jgi:hypothetical protein